MASLNSTTTTNFITMKSFVISAIIGAAALCVKPSLAETLAKAKRGIEETCREAPDGQVQCWKEKAKRGTDETCWETRDGQVECWKAKVKRGTDETCWETPDGQIECWKAKVKRGTDETCWETPDGQVECWKAKRDSEETCWETPDGQIECWKAKAKRGTDETCWETSDGQVECWKGKTKRAASAKPVYSPGLIDNIVQPVGILPPPGLITTGSTTQCAEWWLVSNHTAQSAQCLSALVAGQNITFAQFRKLNPSVNFDCSNLIVEYAYCIRGPGIFGAAASSTAGSNTVVSGSNNDLSGSGFLSYTRFFPSWNSSAAASQWTSQLASASDTSFPLTTATSVPSPAAASSAAPSATGTDALWNSIDDGLAGVSVYPTSYPSWNISTAAASSSSQPTAASNAPLPSAGVTSVSSTAAASSSIASAAEATFSWSSGDGNYSSISSFPSSTASSLLVNKPSNISHTISADYAHVSWAGPSHSQTSSAEYAHVSWTGPSNNYHTSSAEFALVSSPASSTFATVTSGPSSRARTLV
ncbi:MAG: hypothetical protein Q9194_003875 [Teloschistes cf. exilis]